jgi:hypothetical protein
MLPTIPESKFEAMEGNIDPSNDKKYVYDIKFEVVLKEAIGTIPGKASLIKSLMTIKNAKRKKEKIDFSILTASKSVQTSKESNMTILRGRFCMEIGGSEDNNLFFACKIQMNITFSTIKGRTINEFKRHGIFFKIHQGGFKHRVNWLPIGFFIKQHVEQR